LPLDMATLSETHVAVLLRPGKKEEPYYLAVYDVAGKLPEEKSRFRLPNTSPDIIPVLAAAQGGRYLAVANYDSQHTIRLFAVRDLLEAHAEPTDALRIPSAATAARQVAFATRAGKAGIWLGDASARRLEGGRLFEVAGRKLSESPTGW